MLCEEDFTELSCSEFSADLEVLYLHWGILYFLFLLDLGKGACRGDAVVILIFLFIEEDHFEDLVVIVERLFINLILGPVLERLVAIDEVPLIPLILRVIGSAGEGLGFDLMIGTIIALAILVFRETDKIRAVVVLFVFLGEGFWWNRGLVFFTPDWAVYVLCDAFLLD